MHKDSLMHKWVLQLASKEAKLRITNIHEARSSVREANPLCALPRIVHIQIYDVFYEVFKIHRGPPTCSPRRPRPSGACREGGPLRVLMERGVGEALITNMPLTLTSSLLLLQVCLAS